MNYIYMLCLDGRVLKGEFGAEMAELMKLNFIWKLIGPPLRCCNGFKRASRWITSILQQRTRTQCLNICRMGDTGLITDYTVKCIHIWQGSFSQVNLQFSGSWHLMELLRTSWTQEGERTDRKSSTNHTGRCSLVWAKYHKTIYMKESQKDHEGNQVLKPHIV